MSGNKFNKWFIEKGESYFILQDNYCSTHDDCWQLATTIVEN